MVRRSTLIGTMAGLTLLALPAIPVLPGFDAAGAFDSAPGQDSASGLDSAPGLEPGGLFSSAAAAQEVDDHVLPTRLVVRVVSNDAKVIGSGVGGARVLVRDVATGRVLAEGIQEGGTGDTDAIMGPRERGATVFDRPGTAAFETTLPLNRPTRVEVEARGPVGTPHAEQTASATLLMIPGVDVAGEGLILTLHGFTVVIETPDEASGDADDPPGRLLPVRANVTMLCGCPIESGGLWDADRINVTARLVRGDEVMAEAPLEWAGERNIFTGGLVPPTAGAYELQVVAVDPERVNAGIDRRPVTVR